MIDACAGVGILAPGVVAEVARLVAPRGHSAGLYAALIEAHERELEIYAARRIPPPPVIAERLARLRAGASVEVPTRYLPEGARPRPVPGRPRLRALVTSDGVMSVRSESAREWLAENGLDT